jgi:outer membrane receptor protein involved in Fe transport
VLRIFTIPVLLILFSSFISAQPATLQGNVSDASLKEPLIGANVIYQDGKGTSTDIDGNYTLSLEPGTYKLTFSYLGYQSQSRTVDLKAGEVRTLNIALTEEGDMLDEIVITSSVFGKRASEEVISIEVIKADFINIINPVRFDDIARRVTGLNVVDGQANIRAGSGWAYGVGSRVMMIVDGQPFLSPDRFDIKWTLLPIENIGQIEVLKGASSVLYGSSAMNGTINLQSIKPTSTPYNKLVAYSGFIGTPEREVTKWWSSPRMTNGIYFTRAHKVSEKFEYTVGANMFNAQLQYRGSDEYLTRVNFNVRYMPSETLSFGFRGNFMQSKEVDFFWWENSEGGAFRPAENYTSENIRVTLDPYLVKFGKKGWKHDFKNRVFINRPNFADKPYIMTNNDYQLSKKFLKDWSFVGGVNLLSILVNERDFGGRLSGNFFALYAQAEKKWNKVTVVAGSRFEIFRIQDILGIAAAPINDADGNRKSISPGNWRFGVNYNPFRKTYIRANWGQAFRFPSLAERYANASIGPVGVFPNTELRPEYGWTSEIGIEQKFGSSNKKFSGSFDVALFWQEYNDLVEFLFNFYVPDSVIESGQTYDPFDFAGFKSVNVSKARIAGYEVTWKSEYKHKDHALTANIGYSYSYPIDLNEDILGKQGRAGEYIGNLFKSNFRSAKSLEGDPLTDALLKYRNRHLFTSDIQYTYKGISVGFDIRYYSFIEKVDDPFGFFVPDLSDYRMEEDFAGNMVVGARMFYQINKKNNIGIIVKNLTNNEYYLRPPKLESPVSYSLQYRLEF